MTKIHTAANKILTWTLVLISLFMATNILMYSWPRKIVEAGEPKTTKLSYSRGEEVFVTGHTKVYITGTDTNDVRLQCGSSQYFIKQLNLDVNPIDIDYVFSLGNIPHVTAPSPPSCRIVTTTTYYTKYFLMFTRTYRVTFTTNEFIVTKEIKE